ncbi:hypothetical protein RHGRI_000488 [Rhododendron griersonianum]|uniref:Uncharacterized protein n=1 Tax=Rhododendron griersonianum TaxID=479676 RepID=A0AAV6LJ49_9ERIC|nr:hypothetical protein RHGRI_000488 [Rhododendron griersonianum]
MDDVLDEFTTEALRRKVMEEPPASTSKVRALIPNCCTTLNPSTLVSDFRMKSKMDEITATLQDLFDRRMVLGLQNIAKGGLDRAPIRRLTSSLPIEPCLYGRDKDKKFVARKICFRLEDKMKESEGDEIINKARHSSYTRGYRDGMKKFEAFQKAKNLRTFLPCGSRYQGFANLTSNVSLHLLPRLRRLRVLSLRRYRIGELSNSIGDLKHVRYLDLSCALILTLPESIGTLYNLQTLILRDCKNLKKLPANTSDLISLRHLDITGADSLQEMPPKGKLTSLRTLSNFIVGNGNGSTITELGNLIQLRGTLCISGLENVTDALDARRANLKDKQGLDALLMKWSNISYNSRNRSVESKVLGMLEPHKKLKELSISGYGGLTFPTWVGNSLFSNMVYLKFQNCEKCTSLPPLGQLPSLAKLYIQGMKAVGNVGLEFYGWGCSNPFPALEILTFNDMPEWKDWTPFGVEEGVQAFARLSKLSIISCPKLSRELPKNLPCLRKLDIEECPMLVFPWVPSSTELNEVRNILHFDSLVSLHLNNVLISDSYSFEVYGQAVLRNSRYRLLSSLTSLKVENIRGHTCLPIWLLGLIGLVELYLSGFEELTTLWENELRLQGRLPVLRRLAIRNCPKLISLFAEEGEGDDLKSLQKLSIYSCPCLFSFPSTGLSSTLRELQIEFCDGLLSPLDLTLLNNLEKLYISSCPSLAYLSAGRGLPPALKELTVHCCAKLKSLIAEGMNINSPSLEYIEIWDCKSLKTLPDVMQNNGLKNLSRLHIWNCENLESLPEGWFPTTNLTEFYIFDCKKIEPLPNHAYNNNNNHLASLKKLGLNSSPMATGLVSHILDVGSSFCFTNITANIGASLHTFLKSG